MYPPENHPPAPPGKRQNLIYARALLDNAGGRNSEMSTIAQYLYSALRLRDYPEAAEAFSRISREEMNHLQRFSVLAQDFGEEPRLWAQAGPSKRYWTPQALSYPSGLRPLLEAAIAGEKAAVMKYSQQLKRYGDFGDPQTASALREIIKEEQEHQRIFERLLKKAAQQR